MSVFLVLLILLAAFAIVGAGIALALLARDEMDAEIEPPRGEPTDGSPTFHDFRDRGDPMEKREPGSWSDWEHNQQRERTPGCGRR